MPDAAQILAPFGFNHGLLPATSLGRHFKTGHSDDAESLCPMDGSLIGTYPQASKRQAMNAITAAEDAFAVWRTVPTRKREGILHAIAKALNAHQEPLAELMTFEMGKPIGEARAEVANAVETFMYAAALTQTIGGTEAPTGKPHTHLQERWHPLGPVLIVTAFNFPIALWAWNAAIAVACGNSVIWKPAPQTPFFAAAVQKIVADVMCAHKDVPEGLFTLVMGSNDEVSIPLVASPRIPLVSATGSTGMGRAVGKTVSERLGRVILELGGNAGGILTPSAHLPSSLRHAFFSATFNGGQRCTALRRLIVHQSRYKDVLKALQTAYKNWPVGDEFQAGHRLPPLVDAHAMGLYEKSLKQLKKDGIKTWNPGLKLPKGGCYVQPTLALLEKGAPQPQDETFGPLLYIQPYKTFDEALELHNAVPQGLSSGIFSRDVGEIEAFTSTIGSKAGMASVNDNTGGLEVTLAFGGHGDSGLNSEKGSDSWKNYMRRQSVVVNYGTALPPAMGITFKA